MGGRVPEEPYVAPLPKPSACSIIIAHFWETTFFLLILFAAFLSIRGLVRATRPPRYLMELVGIVLGLVLYLLLVGILIIINEAFCKTTCLKNARRILNENPPDVELNERDPTKQTKSSKRQHYVGDVRSDRIIDI